jgi:hypothetical protein
MRSAMPCRASPQTTAPTTSLPPAMNRNDQILLQLIVSRLRRMFSPVTRDPIVKCCGELRSSRKRATASGWINRPAATAPV